jgi:hypothetical protein
MKYDFRYSASEQGAALDAATWGKVLLAWQRLMLHHESCGLALRRASELERSPPFHALYGASTLTHQGIYKRDRNIV